MRLFTPFIIPKKKNCDHCRIEKNKKKKQLRIHYQITFFKTYIGKDLISLSTDLKILVDGLLLEDQTQENPLFREGSLALIVTQSA